MTDDEIIQICGEHYADGTWDDEPLGFARLIERLTLERVLKLSDTHITNARLLDAVRALIEPTTKEKDE